MTKKNQRPLYKNILIIIPAIVAIIAAILGATWMCWLNPPPSDFVISVNPMKGDVHPSGVITTTITIKDIGGYEYPVSLSAAGQPSGVVVTFVPSFGRSKPSYTSTVTINADPTVSAGNYSIVMKGTGADGKEHSFNYILTVKLAVTPTSTPMPTPTLPTYLTTPMPLPTATPKSTRSSGIAIQTSLGLCPEKVSRGEEVNFSWNIIQNPELSFTYNGYYCFEIVDSEGRIIDGPKRFLIEGEEISGHVSWKVPLNAPTGLYSCTLNFPCDDTRLSATTRFEVVETLLVIRKFYDTNQNSFVENMAKRLQGWKFQVTDPLGNTNTYITDRHGEIRIQIIEGREGKYLLEELLVPGWVSELPIKQIVNVPKGKTTNVNFLNAGAMAARLLLIQKFNDTNLNGKIESSDERLAGWEFKVTDPVGKTTTHLTDDSGEITLEVPAEYEREEYIIEETLLPGWEPVLPIKQTVKVLKGEGITVKFLNKKPISITLTYNDFELENVCTPEDNYCGWANVPGKAIIYGSMTTNITVPEGASELVVTISIGCNGYGEGLLGQPGSAAYIRVDNEVREERIDSTMNYHHGNYYKYEWCDTFSNTFNVRGKEAITLIIEMNGSARLDFEEAILTFS